MEPPSRVRCVTLCISFRSAKAGASSVVKVTSTLMFVQWRGRLFRPKTPQAFSGCLDRSKTEVNFEGVRRKTGISRSSGRAVGTSYSPGVAEVANSASIQDAESLVKQAHTARHHGDQRRRTGVIPSCSGRRSTAAWRSGRHRLDTKLAVSQCSQTSPP